MNWTLCIVLLLAASLLRAIKATKAPEAWPWAVYAIGWLRMAAPLMLLPWPWWHALWVGLAMEVGIVMASSLLYLLVASGQKRTVTTPTKYP